MAVRVQPGARREGLLGRLPGGEWKLAVAAPPEGGRANAAVVELLAGLLGLPKGRVSIVSGTSSRAKWIELAGMDAVEAERRMSARLRADEAGGDGRANGE